MADRSVDILIVGGGVAGAGAAQELAERGFSGSVLQVARELDPPYQRPPLTKEYLRGEQQRDDAFVPEPGWYEQRDEIELLTRTSVTAFDPRARTAALSTKQTVAFDKALIATGSLVRRLHVEGAELDGLHYVRAFGNVDAIRADLPGVERAVCVGGSYIGCEAAASLTELGIQTTILMQEAEPFGRGFGATAGAWFRGVLSERGVTIVGEDEVERFAGADGRLTHVVTKGGREIAAQVAVLGVGVQPDVALAKGAGLALGESGGVACDAQLRSSASGIWAAGDICEYESVVHGRRIRVEHTEHAAAQGRYVARAMLGASDPYDEVPYFFSDLADWASLEYVGPARDWDREVVRGELESGTFGIWYLQDGRVRGALSVGGGLDLDVARALIVAGEQVADEDLPGI